MALKTIFSYIVGPGKILFPYPPSRGSLAGDILIRILNLDGLVKVSKSVNPAAAGLILLDSRFHGNDENGYFLTFYETITLGCKGWISGSDPSF
ncbi:MAG: hypothetical protein JRF52_07625 [Deltaproteobacteria bacterium]|nr:hypothetical protein [Deltaproteobacteria bacterium]